MKPAPLHPGDTIAVVAPASAPREAARLDAGIDYLRRLGYRVETGRTDFGPHGFLCGPDDVRLEEFNAFLRRDDVRALFCVRGGYGTLRLLPHLDYDAARRRPKLLVGYSDVTALHLGGSRAVTDEGLRHLVRGRRVDGVVGQPEDRVGRLR